MDVFYFWYNQTGKDYKSLHIIDISPEKKDSSSPMFPQMDGLAYYIAQIMLEQPITRFRNELSPNATTFSGKGIKGFPEQGEYTIERPLDTKELEKLDKLVKKELDGIKKRKLEK